LKNFGNTCFMNATVQMLRTSNAICRCIEEHTVSHKENGRLQYNIAAIQPSEPVT